MKPMKTIKDGWNKFTVVVKDKDYSTREAVLFAICTFLTGLVLGMLCSPRKSQTFGSYNGNCSDGGCNCDCDYDESFERRQRRRLFGNTKAVRQP